MLIKVKAFPGAKKEAVIKKTEDSFDIKVRERPVMGQANRAIALALSGHFKVPFNKVRLIRGFRERNKLFEIS